jgi:hypothetical protein
VETGERAGQRAGRKRLGGSAVEGEKREKGGGVRAWGATQRGGAVGPAPDRWAAPASARVRRRRATCAARTRADWIERGERRLTGGLAQCRAAVTGGSGLSAVRESTGRGHADARVGQPEKKRRWAARMHSTVLDLFESV